MKLNIIKNYAGTLALKNLKKFIIIFGLFILGFIWLSLLYKIENERKIETNNAIKATANLARVFEEHTLRTLKNADQALLFLKFQYEKEGRRIDISQYVREDRFSNQPFVLMGVINENGDFVTSSQESFVPSNLKDREHFFVHKDFDSETLFISKPVLGRSSGKWAIQMTRRINNPDGSFGGVAVVSVDPFYFTEFYKQVDLGRNAAITLVGLDGIVRARQAGQDAETGQDLSNSVIMEKLSNSTSGYYIAKSQVDGIKRIYSYRALQNYPLAVAVGVTEAEALGGLEQRIIGYCLIAIIGTIVIILFIILLLQTIKYQKRDKDLLEQAYSSMEAKVLLRTKELFLANKELAFANEDLQKVNKKLERKTEEVRKIAYADALTGLPNRLHFNERINTEMDKARRGEASGSVMFVDLDDFKNINDVFGHSQGDALLIMAGKRIMDKFGDGAFVARIGGDEFVIILPGVSDRSRIADIADKIVKELCIAYKVGGEVFVVSASIGIAIYPYDGNTTDEILKNADNAMYTAKKKDKNCWCFYEPAMQAEALERMVLRNSLHYAIERGELSLKYQPLVTTKQKVIVGFEALLRWNSPEHGFVSPARFIPLAEQSGLIHQIGAWVLKEACDFARRLTASGHENVYIAVNISGKQIAEDNFVSIVRSAIEGAGIKPEQVELEITESYLMVSMEDAVRKFGELRDMGVRLALDDFGTGFSSLTYLWNLPANTLKIDKSFIDIILQDISKAHIVTSIIKMAHDLNMIVVAEGVEYRQQYVYLFDNSCDVIQGYYISKPVRELEATRLLGDMRNEQGTAELS